MLKMPYIHYKTSLYWHQYKSAGLSFLIMIYSFVDVEHKKHNDKGKVTSVCTEDVDCTVNAKQIFWQENEEYLLFTMGWRGRLLFFLHTPHRRCCLCNEVMPTEVASNLPTGFYDLQPTM